MRKKLIVVLTMAQLDLNYMFLLIIWREWNPSIKGHQRMDYLLGVPVVSSEDIEIKPECSGFAEQEKELNVGKLEGPIGEGQVGGLKKHRGRRKRKDSERNINKTSVRESNVLSSVDVSGCKEGSTSNIDKVVKSSDRDEKNKNLRKDRMKDIMDILDSILKFKGPSFHRKHDSQKRGRYRKMIRQHMDLDTIRSRIRNRTIKSAVELFRDLHLLINNALVFYSKSTYQYKNAQLLRDMVKERLKEFIKAFSSSVTNADVSITLPVNEPPLKLRTVCPGNRKIVAEESGGRSNSTSEESLRIKKSCGRSKKVGRETIGSRRPATPMERKGRIRRKDYNAEDLVPTQV
ncbi:putative chromatin remodeler Bromodomain family [Lupinus albus]|uniref:Putative chromatin remodeler Bromodomain family n=1 Tax=Lupinus albus TaxID=3870 RepID=A0A6A4Q098_LUPAL|nr:putative chromatin remodeler Bromodomain family [Lupinus albus]